MVAHCLFEQSGTFKNEFIKMGFDALDYDIQNEFGQTDVVCDLFQEINNAFEGGVEGTIFEKIEKEDIIFAFFPCTRFEAQIHLWFRGDCVSMKNWNDLQKLKYVMQLHDELALFYRTFSKMFCVAIKNGLRMIIENPCTPPHYLTTYFPIKPSMIDKDRSKNGDYYKKPTQYWFINFKPQTNFLMEAEEYQKTFQISNHPHIKGKNTTISRSMIHPNYARRFIYNNVLTKEQAKQVIERGKQ